MLIPRVTTKAIKEDLAHGQFGKWLESIKMNQNTADRFMKIVNELPNSDTYHNLGWQALYQIATMPEEGRVMSTLWRVPSKLRKPYITER